MVDLTLDPNHWDNLKSKSCATEWNLTDDEIANGIEGDDLYALDIMAAYAKANGTIANPPDSGKDLTFEQIEESYRTYRTELEVENCLKPSLDAIAPDKDTMLCLSVHPTVFARMKNKLDRPLKNIIYRNDHVLINDSSPDSDTIVGDIKTILADNSQIDNVNIIYSDVGHWDLFDETNLAIFNYAKNYLPSDGILHYWPFEAMPQVYKDDTAFSYFEVRLKNSDDQWICFFIKN